MPFLKFITSRFGRRKPRRKKDSSPFITLLDTSRWVTGLIFILTVASIVFISSFGVSTVDLPLLPNQLATTRVTAALSFSYESKSQTKLARERARDRVPPVYKLDDTKLTTFLPAANTLFRGLDQLEGKGDHDAQIEDLTAAFNLSTGANVSPKDVALLANELPAKTRDTLVKSGLTAVREIYVEGVHDETLGLSRSNNITVFQIKGSDGEISLRHVQSLEEALRYLRINLADQSVPRNLSMTLFRVLRSGVEPNLSFDQAASSAREQAAVEAIKPVELHIARGQTIVERGSRVTPEQYEMLVAHRKALQSSAGTRLDDSLLLIGRIMLVLAMVVASVFYIRLEDRETFQSNARLALLAMVVILNIALVRAVFSLNQLAFFSQDSTWASILPYVASSAFAPLIVALLIDAGSAIFMALFISIFTGVIYGNRLDLLVLTFLASIVSIFACRDVRKRSQVVRSAGLGGLTVAVFALMIGLVDQLAIITLLKQFVAGITSGLVTGVIVVGVLPLFEGLFKRTTNITLLELTDYNHPLLRKMQLEAPGTYHHSLVVAQLSENACAEIGANPILARVCALFHDIGKTVKPEYFIENQRDRANPHDASNPSLSALIIKSHVKDGVDLARKHHLPRRVIHVIRQHHGTSLIRYFYYRAVTHCNDTRAPFEKEQAPPGLAPVDVSETTYRYDGPIPQFTESAVISLADGVEAASRTLRKVTPQSIGELIDTIFEERINDQQLDDSPLTFSDLAKIKASFTYTLVNMLHARIQYPSGDPAATEGKA